MVEQVNNYLDFKAQPLFKEYQCGGSITTALSEGGCASRLDHKGEEKTPRFTRYSQL